MRNLSESKSHRTQGIALFAGRISVVNARKGRHLDRRATWRWLCASLIFTLHVTTSIFSLVLQWVSTSWRWQKLAARNLKQLKEGGIRSDNTCTYREMSVLGPRISDQTATLRSKSHHVLCGQTLTSSQAEKLQQRRARIETRDRARCGAECSTNLRAFLRWASTSGRGRLASSRRLCGKVVRGANGAWEDDQGEDEQLSRSDAALGRAGW
jgi:hypothetical protein